MTKEERKEYYQANRDKILEHTKEYRKNNPDKLAEQKRKYYKAKHLKKYQKTHPDKVNALAQKHRALKINQLHPDRNDNIIKVLYELSTRLTKCTGIIHHVDHIIPISKGGYHHELNLQVIPACINLRKNDNINFSHPLLKTYEDVPQFLKNNNIL